MILATSPDRNSFQLKKYQERLLNDPSDEDALTMIEDFKSFEQLQEDRFKDPEFCKNNMEYSLRSTQWIIDKVRESRVYAQHLYAAMCNNEFYTINGDEQQAIIDILGDRCPRWSASWRAAGGIIAHLRGEGDYIDWYCSGIRDQHAIDDEVFRNMTRDEQEAYLEAKAFISESIVTDEIREDLRKLGWYVTVE